MSDQPTGHQPEPQPVDYGPGWRRSFSKRQFWTGLTVSLLTCGVCFALLFFATFAYIEADASQPQPWAWVAMVTTVVAVVGLLAVAVIAQRRGSMRGFLAGVLLGIGLTALPVGFCFSIVGSTAVGS